MQLPTKRFALLRHEVPAEFPRPSHWDLLLEWEGVAWTWELRELPALWTKQGAADPLVVRRLPDHRLDYLEYEGPISGNRGVVSRHCGGTCHWQVVERQTLQAKLVSTVWTSQVTLVRLPEPECWQLEAVSTHPL